MPGDPLSRRLATIVALDVAGYSAYVDSNVVLWELAPDQRMELGWFWLAVDRHAAVVSVRRVR